MANPTANKPAVPFFDSSLGLGAGVKTAIVYASGAGQPVEYVGKKLPQYWQGPLGFGTGRPPQWIANGFPYSPNGGDPTMRFMGGTKATSYLLAAPGWAASSVRTLLCVFKHNIPVWNPNGVVNVGVIQQVGGSQTDGTPQGLYISVAQGGTGTIGYIRGYAGVSLSGPNLLVNEWYALALTFDDSGGTKNRTFRLYRYSTQSLVTAGGGLIVTDGSSNPQAPGTSDYHSNPCTSGSNSFIGEKYGEWTHTGTFGDTEFATFYGDPFGTMGCRGTYTPTGVLTAGTAKVGAMTDLVIELTATRATGTGTGGTGVPTYQWVRSTVADGTYTPISGATSLVFVDTTAVKGTTYYYRMIASDGSSTVTYPGTTAQPATGILRPYPAIGIPFLGDSMTEANQNPQSCARMISGMGGEVHWMNRGKSGAVCAGPGAGSWSAGVGPASFQLSVTGGTPTSGNFGLTGIGNDTGAVLSWSASAAAVQSALQALGSIGSGNVLCTGGPLPGTPIVGVFAGTLALATATVTIQTGTSTLNNSAVPTMTTIRKGFPPGDLLPYTVAEVNSDPIWGFIHFMIGTNDSALGYTTAVHLENLRQTVAAFRAQMPQATVILSAPPYRSDGVMTAAFTEFLRACQDAITTVASEDPTNVKVGDISNWAWVASAPNELIDGVHFLNTAIAESSSNWARAVIRVAYPSTSGPAAKVRSRQLTRGR